MKDATKGSYWLYADVPPPMENATAWTKMILALGVDGVCISTHTGRNKKTPLYLSDVNPLYLAKCTKALHEVGKGVSWMTHPCPGTVELKEHEKDLDFLYKVALSEGVDVARVTPQFDLESWWFDASNDDAKQLVSITDRSEYIHRVSVNFVPKLRGRPDVSVERVLQYPQVHAAVVQFYQFYGPPGHWSRNDAYRFGGGFENACYACAEHILENLNPTIKIVMAQALYAQDHPGEITGTDALGHWLRGVRARGYLDHFGWSLKHTRDDLPRVDRTWSKKVANWLSKERVHLMKESGPNINYLAVQTALAMLGFYQGNIDNIWGPKSTTAFMTFCKENNLPMSSSPDAVSLSYLLHDCITFPR